MRIVLVRHGATLWSESGRHTGRTDIPLTEEGRDQARALAPLLFGYSPKTALSSPLLRARETAELAGFGDRIRIDPDLSEWDYGAYEGLTTAQIRHDRPGWDLFADGVPKGESPEEAGHRAERIVTKLRLENADSILFAHGHILRLVVASWLGLSPDRARHFALKTATLTLLGYEHEWPALLTMNGLAPLTP
ncbi:MAG: histidine phosphatase family protein [Leptospirillia bacterium]